MVCVFQLQLCRPTLAHDFTENVEGKYGTDEGDGGHHHVFGSQTDELVIPVHLLGHGRLRDRGGLLDGSLGGHGVAQSVLCGVKGVRDGGGGGVDSERRVCQRENTRNRNVRNARNTAFDHGDQRRCERSHVGLSSQVPHIIPVHNDQVKDPVTDPGTYPVSRNVS